MRAANDVAGRVPLRARETQCHGGKDHDHCQVRSVRGQLCIWRLAGRNAVAAAARVGKCWPVRRRAAWRAAPITRAVRGLPVAPCGPTRYTRARSASTVPLSTHVISATYCPFAGATTRGQATFTTVTALSLAASSASKIRTISMLCSPSCQRATWWRARKKGLRAVRLQNASRHTPRKATDAVRVGAALSVVAWQLRKIARPRAESLKFNAVRQCQENKRTEIAVSQRRCGRFLIFFF